MSKLQNLYTELISNRRPDVDGWYQAYKAFHAEVDSIGRKIFAGSSLADKATYQSTRFYEKPEPQSAFLEELILSQNNGVADVGLSFLSRESYNKLIVHPDFIPALEKLLKAPTENTFRNFRDTWERIRVGLGIKGTPLRINRVLSARILSVSSTVDYKKFDQVYNWLVDEKLIASPSSPSLDWFAKNIHVMEELDKSFRQTPPDSEVDEILLSIFVWQLWLDQPDPFAIGSQVIKYGAPGTGKTFTAKRDCKLAFDVWRSAFGAGGDFKFEAHHEVVQFHPSYGYEDFVEGLRPVLNTEKKVDLKLQNGAFKRFCQRASLWEKDTYEIEQNGVRLPALWPDLTIQDIIPFKERLTGKHWSHIWNYPDPSIFLKDAIPPFFFIVDEINRAELSRVLGELLYCLEYRGVKGAISTQYSTLNDEVTGMIQQGDAWKFFIPHNVYMVGTMNTIDRSVESFDLALRRRFRWERVNPDIRLVRFALQSTPWNELADNLEALNREIGKAELLGEDYQIGHAYLMNLQYSRSLTIYVVRNRIWADRILPLLEEYLRGSGKFDELCPLFKKAFGIK